MSDDIRSRLQDILDRAENATPTELIALARAYLPALARALLAVLDECRHAPRSGSADPTVCADDIEAIIDAALKAGAP